MRTFLLAMSLGPLFGACATVSGAPAAGGAVEPSADEQAALGRVGTKVKGLVVWSSARNGNHDLFLSNPDGTGVKQLTQGDQVEWFSRFAPDGKRILFTRSKQGFVYERDCNKNWLWDLFLVNVDGSDPKLVAKDASWGTWIDDQRILFSRATKVYSLELASGTETLLVDSEQVAGLGGAELQQPQLSADGKYLAITLRGSKRETGILELATKVWTKTGEGCQINWTPGGDKIYWVNQSGNGGSEVFLMPVASGKPTRDFAYEELRYIDIPGRRSHEYFPQLSRDGKWLVWAATARGHDHDIADYEIYIWEVGAPASEATRLTFHTSNDRWPDISLANP